MENFLVNELTKEYNELNKQPFRFPDQFRNGYKSCINDLRIILKEKPQEEIDLKKIRSLAAQLVRDLDGHRLGVLPRVTLNQLIEALQPQKL